MIGSIKPFCNGMGCPDKMECARYKVGIDCKSEDFLAYAPYSHIEKRCGFKVAFSNHKDVNFLEQLKLLKDGGTKNNTTGES